MENLERLNNLYAAMLEYFKGDPRRCQHWIKVHSLSRMIGLNEHLAEHTLYVLEAAAMVHDCGIKPGEAKYGRNDGKIQEQEGPDAAAKLLAALDFGAVDIERICFLVGHHHTYNVIDSIDFQILVEADFLVNFYEDNMDKKAIESCVKKIFKTQTGKKFACAMFGLGGDDDAAQN